MGPSPRRSFRHRWAERGEKRKPSLEMKGQWMLSPFCPSTVTRPVLDGVAQIHPGHSDNQRGRDTATHWVICKAIQPCIPHPGNSQQNGNLGRAQREDGGFIYAAGERERKRGKKCLFRFIKRYQFAVLALYLHSRSQHSSRSCLTQNNFLDTHFVSTGNSFQSHSSAEQDRDSRAVIAASVPCMDGASWHTPTPRVRGH